MGKEERKKERRKKKDGETGGWRERARKILEGLVPAALDAEADYIILQISSKASKVRHSISIHALCLSVCLSVCLLCDFLGGGIS